jgi:hypothetical protein
LIPKQLRIHAVLIVAALFMILIPLYNQSPDSEKVEQAKPAAIEFLGLIDGAKYAESWESSADLMRDKVTRNDWIDKLDKARNLSGDLVQRVQKSASYATEAKDSPEGEYIMLIYESDFQRAEDVSEYVTVMLEGDEWKVAGYFMQQ